MPELTTGQAIREALSLCLDTNKTTFIAGEDIGVYGGAFGVTDGLLEKYGEDRIKDTPISEDVIAGLAVGAAITGSMPIVEMQFIDFIVYSRKSVQPTETVPILLSSNFLLMKSFSQEIFDHLDVLRRRHRELSATFDLV